MLQIDKYSLKKKATMATTYMNISAILSSLGKYTESYKLVKKANAMFLELKEEQLSNLKQENTSVTMDNMILEQDQTVIVNFIVSYFNMGIAAECSGNKKLAYEHATQGYHFALVDLGMDHRLTQSLNSYVQKLSDDIAQGMLVRPPPKQQKIEPSSRLHDTSYTIEQPTFAGGLADRSHEGSKFSQLRSRHRSMSTNKAADKSVAIDEAGQHYLRFDRHKDEVSLVGKVSRPPAKAPTAKLKTMAQLKTYPVVSMVEKRKKIQSQRRAKDNELAALLQNIAGGRGKKGSLRAKSVSEKERGGYRGLPHLQNQFTFNSHHDDQEKRGSKIVKPSSKYLNPIQGYTEGQPSKNELDSRAASIAEREYELALKETELREREKLLNKLAKTHEVETYHKRLHENVVSRTEEKPAKPKNSSRPKIERVKNHVVEKPENNSTSKLDEWLQARYAKPVQRVGGLVNTASKQQSGSEIKGDPTLSEEPSPTKISHLDSGDVSKGREYLNRKYNIKESKPPMIKKAPAVQGGAKIDPNHYDREEEEALIEYRKRLRAYNFPGVEAHLEEVKNHDRSQSPRPDKESKEEDLPQIEPKDIYFNQFESADRDMSPGKDDRDDLEEGLNQQKYNADASSKMKQTGSWASSYGMKKVVAYNLKYIGSTED